MNRNGFDAKSDDKGTDYASKKKGTLKKTPVILESPESAAKMLARGMSPVFLVRHGQTDFNIILKLQGREDVALNETGVSQARECAEVLKEASKNGLSVEKVFSSPLSRAKETADIISEALNLGAVSVEWDLIERDYGELSGLTLDERKKKFPKGEKQAKNVESVPDAAKRIEKALSKITQNGKNGVVAVTHGGVINALFLIITKSKIGTGKTLSENCGISIVATDGETVIPLAYNLRGKLLLEYTEKMNAPIGGNI